MRATSRLAAIWSQMRIDCFEINKWPALASHLMAFFLGVVCLNQAQCRVDGTSRGFPRRALLVKPSFTFDGEIKALKDAATVDLVLQRKEGEACRMNSEGLQPIKVRDETLLLLSGGEPQELEPLVRMLWGEKRRDLHLLAAGAKPSPLAACQASPRVSYDD